MGIKTNELNQIFLSELVHTGKHKEVQASTNMYKRGKTLI